MKRHESTGLVGCSAREGGSEGRDGCREELGCGEGAHRTTEGG